MILEIAMLSVVPGLERDFEENFAKAREIVASSPGFVSLELHRCLEAANRYALLVRWRNLEDHTTGFRDSPAYAEWKGLLHRFYDPLPQVRHYREVVWGSSA
jgi:heme-degrading monooxygenase HmoA